MLFVSLCLAVAFGHRLFFRSPHLAHAGSNIKAFPGTRYLTKLTGFVATAKSLLHRAQQCVGQEAAACAVDMLVAVPTLLSDMVLERSD